MIGEKEMIGKSNFRIKWALVSVVVLAILTIPGVAQGPRERAPEVKSPEIHSDGRITFRIHAPKAGNVMLEGSDLPGMGMGRGRAMEKGDEGIWEIRVGPVEPGSYRYHFNIDGVAVIDPKNTQVSESNENVWSLVHLTGSDLMDTQKVPHGAISEVTYYSNSLQRFRRAHVYTPAGYESGEGKFPIFYLLHGAFDSDDSWSTVGRAGVILDNLIADGKAKPMVVVMPDGHTGPFNFGMQLPVNEFLSDFLQDLQPYVEKVYRVYTNRENRAIAGLSMGGAHTLAIGIPHLDQYAYLGVFSSGIFGMGPGAPGLEEFKKQNEKFLSDHELKKGLRLFWFATGKEDFLVQVSRSTVEMFKEQGFDVVYKETEGAHTWNNWRNYLNEFATQLFQ
jgi:enterochelin esterase family protein